MRSVARPRGSSSQADSGEGESQGGVKALKRRVSGFNEPGALVSSFKLQV